ncbi:oxalate decarboxylase [Crepidotus variabilis]|uniref:Oxalate decarboxylase n=1 Tax=Crepidotus variabilis TaxID=179855 RepID=A0A9P6EAB9_9AGAR|nr:oxalate decarboxylase [Crepidotus variabilis]
MIKISTCYLALLLSGFAWAAPASSSASQHSSAVASASATKSSAGSASIVASSTGSAASSTATVPYISLNPNYPLWGTADTTTESTPEAERGTLGATVIGPTDASTVWQNPDLLAPPTTDGGSVQVLSPNAKWPMSLSHNRLQTGGWARQQNTDVMPFAANMAGVDMRLESGAIRELHWHKTAEWAYVLKGTTQISTVNPDGQNYVANVGPGDLWYFPPGVPHSLQATNEDPDGTEFLLVFDSGDFSEDDTFLLTDWMAHTPAEVLAKNFQTDISTFAQVPAKELYIFPGQNPLPPSAAPISPAGTAPTPYTYNFSSVAPTQVNGGTYKIIDSSTFAISKTIAASEITLEPGAIRELHWHPTQDEWNFFINGTGRVTVFASSGNARTFDYQAGDVGYIPATMGHYVENTGNTTLHFIEIFNTAQYQDISLSNWLALVPPALVQAHLGFSDEFISTLPKTKQVLVGPSNSTSSVSN